jgi:hypothetical protein
MSDQFINLGTAAVMDAERLSVGTYVEVYGRVLVVANIVDNLHVYWRPVTGWDLCKYRWNKMPLVQKIVIAVTVVALLLGIVIRSVA